MIISTARRSAVVLTTHALKQSSARHFSAHTTSKLYPFLRTHYRAGFVNEQKTRGMTTFKQSDITLQEYHRASDTTMEALLDSLESLIDQNTDLPYEVDYSSGVLTLNLADQGIYVINKQPPNKQIWLSSPRSGPKRYDLDATEKEWFYTRDNTTMRSLLEDELSEVFGKRIQIDLGEQV